MCATWPDYLPLIITISVGGGAYETAHCRSFSNPFWQSILSHPRFRSSSSPHLRSITLASRTVSTGYHIFSETQKHPVRRRKGTKGEVHPRAVHEGSDGGRPIPRPGRFTPGETDQIPTVQEAGWAPRPVGRGAKKLALTGIRFSDPPARGESPYRLRYPDPLKETSTGRNFDAYFLRTFPSMWIRISTDVSSAVNPLAPEFSFKF